MDLQKKLRFKIELRAKVPVIVWGDGGYRHANESEYKMWNLLEKLNKKPLTLCKIENENGTVAENLHPDQIDEIAQEVWDSPQNYFDNVLLNGCGNNAWDELESCYIIYPDGTEKRLVDVVDSSDK